MSNKETTKKHAETNGSLMKHTKAQLVDIILRKDNIEKELRADIENIKKELEHKINYLKSINNNYNSMQNNYRRICDDRATIEYEFSSVIKKQKVFIWLLSIILCISIALNYIFVIV